VCARADEPRACEGSIFGKYCAGCRAEVMIAPSGQDILRLHPDMKIICGPCFGLVREPHKIALAASPEQIRNEAKTARPNMRRFRN
jgi:hypothetical protein